MELNNIINNTLSKLIDSDYIYLDLPYYDNPGDILIWEGTEQLLSKLPYKCLYKTSFNNFQYQDISKDTIIILQGGGNFGDLYRELQDFRKHIIQTYPSNKIIILPQTVYYEDYKHLREDTPVFASHRHLTICARDKYSYLLLRLFRVSRNIKMFPDMAFCIEEESLQEYCLPETNETLYVKRVDKEISCNDDYSNIRADLVSDWPPYMKKDNLSEKLYSMLRDKGIDKTLIDQFAYSVFRPHMIKVAVEFVSKYKEIYTTRLHVAILSAILKKNVKIIDNSYGKNSQFYNTWFIDQPNIMCLTQNSQSLLSWSILKNAIGARIDQMRINMGELRRRIC